MSDFIYDDQGACVARIVDGNVIAEKDERKIATVREGNVYALNGELIGHLQDAHLIPNGSGTPPIAWTNLLNDN